MDSKAVAEAEVRKRGTGALLRLVHWQAWRVIVDAAVASVTLGVATQHSTACNTVTEITTYRTSDAATARADLVTASSLTKSSQGLQ